MTRNIPAALAVLLAMLLAAALSLAPAAPAVNAAGSCAADATLDSEEQAFLALINDYRAQNGLPTLTPSYTLSLAAAWKSADLGSNAYFAHDDLNRTWVQRVRDCGYSYNTYIGENIAAGASSARQVFNMWKNSPGHNANMLGASYRTIGIGRQYVAGSPYGWYWTTDFGGYDDGWARALDGEQLAPVTAPSPDRGHRSHAHAPRRGTLPWGRAPKRLPAAVAATPAH
jgi:uncharacterized protein YkwD